MILAELKIQHLRVISTAHLFLHPRFTFICGANGSGKTSILEALYLLSCGHSFRSREISSIISYQQPNLNVFARSTERETISIQKAVHQPTLVKLNNTFCTATSELAYALPCQVFYADIFQIIDAGSMVRRSLLDWGMFHVKHEYHQLWKEYKKIIKQRNALLKTKAPYEHFKPWDKMVCEVAMNLDEMRRSYFSEWEREFYAVLPQLTEIGCNISYYRGWDRREQGTFLSTLLEESFLSDKQKGYTQYGAHQADIMFETNDKKAKQILSRGQQKIILFALKLAQGNLLQKDCLYLFDDFAAELDHEHQHRVLSYIKKRPGQYVFTHLDDKVKNIFPAEEFTHFCLNKGAIQQL